MKREWSFESASNSPKKAMRNTVLESSFESEPPERVVNRPSASKLDTSAHSSICGESAESKVDLFLRELRSNAKLYFSKPVVFQDLPSIRPKCKLLNETFSDFVWIADEEAHFQYNPSERSRRGNKRYQRYLNRRKVTVWAAISKNGISKLVIKHVPANSKESYQECLQTGLIPFIKEQHPDDEAVLWPNLASTHYAVKTYDFMKESNITFVEKRMNPGSLPKCRPLADYMTMLKYLVYADDWTARNARELKGRIREMAEKIHPEVVQEMTNNMREMSHRLKDIELNGVYGNRGQVEK